MGAIGLFKALDLQVVRVPGRPGPARRLGRLDRSVPRRLPRAPSTTSSCSPAHPSPTSTATTGRRSSPAAPARTSSPTGRPGPRSPGWPKLTSDWTVATPLIGSFGTDDTKSSSTKVVVGITRSGIVHAYRTEAPACSPSSSPRFHHDNANSGDYSRDAVLPGAPAGLKVKKGKIQFGAPGDDLLCGTVDHYEMATAKSTIDESSFAAAKPLGGAPAPKPAGTTQKLAIPKQSKGYVAIRAVDEQGNVGRVASVKAKLRRADRKRCSNLIHGTKRADDIRGTGGGDWIDRQGRQGPPRRARRARTASSAASRPTV